MTPEHITIAVVVFVFSFLIFVGYIVNRQNKKLLDALDKLNQ